MLLAVILSEGSGEVLELPFGGQGRAIGQHLLDLRILVQLLALGFLVEQLPVDRLINDGRFAFGRRRFQIEAGVDQQ